MKTIEQVYGDNDNDYGWSDYGTLLDSFEYEIVLQVDDHDYQGDSRVLFKDGNRYGILIFGWGSCSGCDALQACESLSEVGELRESLNNGIRWGESAEDLLTQMNDKDWTTEWFWHDDGESKEFLKKTKEILSTVAKDNKKRRGPKMGLGFTPRTLDL